MSVDPNLLVIKSVDELQETSNPFNSKVLIYDGGEELKVYDLENLREEVSTGIVGQATPTSSPTPWTTGDPDLYEKWDVLTAGIYSNFLISPGNPIIVTSQDLIDNFVQIWVKNGVSSKALSPKPNATPIVNIDDLFTKQTVEKSTKQVTATGTIANGSVGSVYGISASIGIIPKQFNKVTVPFAQNSASPVTQIEVRLFTGKTSGGTLLAKKRQTVSPGNVTQASVTVTFDSNITYTDEMWVQILMNNPFAYKRVSPATLRTSALGYGTPSVSTTNNLDATTFPTAQGFVDLYLEFNELETSIVSTAVGDVTITDSVTDPYTSDLTGDYTSANSYIDTSGNIIPSGNWRTSEFIPVTPGKTYTYKGSTSQSNAAVCVAGYNSSNVATILVGNSDHYSVPIDVVIPSGIVKVRVCGYVSTPPTWKITEPKIKADLMPIGTTGKIIINKVWNCVGHSIWAQDGLVYSGTSVMAIGMQTLIRRIFKFNGYNKYAYSGRSLGATSSSGDTSSITNYFSTWTDTSDGIWTLDTITNDFKRNIPIGTITDYNNATGVTTYYGALRAFNDKVQSLTPGATIICFNALRRNNSGYTSTSTNTVGHTLLDYEKALMTIAAQNSWRFVDQFRQSEITDETLSITTLDGLHPNNFGYELAVKPAIRIFWIYANEK